MTPPLDAWTPDDVSDLFERVKTWGRWGADDERGTLNYLTPAVVAAAAASVRSGRVVSCARDFPVHPHPENPFPAQHHMVVAGDDPCVPGGHGLETSMDYIGIAFHGMASTHIDALCHVFVQGQMYNGWPATDVKSTGARRNSIMCAKDGIVGRGVLLDLPRISGAPFLDPGPEITPADLEAAETAAGVRIGEGDIVLIRTGRDVRRETVPTSTPDGQRLAGLHPACAGWLHDRRVSVLGGDGVHDPLPGGARYEGWPVPIHMCALAGMGLHLLDNLWLDDLAAACAAEGRWAFLISIAPLRIERGTGSPVNPIAIL
jgi:kynurenine formamidase